MREGDVEQLGKCVSEQFIWLLTINFIHDTSNNNDDGATWQNRPSKLSTQQIPLFSALIFFLSGSRHEAGVVTAMSIMRRNNFFPPSSGECLVVVFFLLAFAEG